jgi:hypothetical protein
LNENLPPVTADDVEHAPSAECLGTIAAHDARRVARDASPTANRSEAASPQPFFLRTGWSQLTTRSENLAFEMTAGSRGPGSRKSNQVANSVKSLSHCV